MKRKLILGLTLLISLIINLILMFTLAWDPFGYYFNQPELSNISYTIRNNLTHFFTVGSLVIIWGSFIYSVFKSIKTKKNNFLSLVISLIFFVALLISNWTGNPEDLYNYSIEKDGYEYMEKYWYVNGDTLFEKWKSVNLYNSELPSNQTEWKLIETNKK